MHRHTYTDLSTRSQELANALKNRGLKHGDHVGTLAWNGYRHLELYDGVWKPWPINSPSSRR